MIESGEVIPLFGAIEMQVQGQPIGKMPGLIMGDVIIIVAIGIALLFTSMAIVRYFYTRRPKKKHRSDARKVFPGDNAPENEEEDNSADEDSEARKRYKYRWKRREHRVRNPTLAETGGLPPARKEEPPQLS